MWPDRQKIPEIRRPDAARVLGANDRAIGRHRSCRHGQHSLPGDNSPTEEIEAHCASFPGMARKGQVLQRALEAAPALKDSAQSFLA